MIEMIKLNEKYNIFINNIATNSEGTFLFKKQKEEIILLTKNSRYNHISVFLRNKNNRILGGASGYFINNWLKINLLWCAKVIRGKGYGWQIMNYLESSAKKYHCTNSHLDTFTSQTPEFYEKIGYKKLVTLSHYNGKSERIYFAKKLDSNNPSTYEDNHLKIEFCQNPTQDNLNTLISGLNKEASDDFNNPGFYPISVLIKDKYSIINGWCLWLYKFKLVKYCLSLV
jgi:N-acetylglutamate synthase-like GNAT family acetyltransferase